MQNAYEVLGLKLDADTSQVRAAYREKVKVCHPDQFTDEHAQRNAQEQLITLNLAYEEALRLSAAKKPGCNSVPVGDAKKFAQRLMEQGNLESALRQLCRADSKDCEWYYLQGQLLMGMHQFDTAHQSFRQAVKGDPHNTKYRQGALDAALAVKRHKLLPYRVTDWFRGAMRKK